MIPYSSMLTIRYLFYFCYSCVIVDIYLPQAEYLLYLAGRLIYLPVKRRAYTYQRKKAVRMLKQELSLFNVILCSLEVDQDQVIDVCANRVP